MTMATVEIYTWQFCPFCLRAKSLLKQKGVEFLEHQIDGDQEARLKMSQRAEGRSTLPQIFINNKGIGGCDELYELEDNKLLNELLGIGT